MPHIHIDIQTEYLILVLTAFLCALFLTYLLYRSTNPPVSRGLRGILFALRFLALFLLLLLLLEPVITFLFDRFEKPVVAVLVDSSASMTFTDRTGDRQATLDTLLHNDVLQQLASTYDLKAYWFAAETRPYALFSGEPVRLEGRATDIGGAIRAVHDSLREANLQAFLLLTDGGNNMGQEPGRVVMDLDLPVFAIAIGDSTEQKDLSIVRIETNEIVYSGDEVAVKVMVRNSGLEETRVPVTLKERETIIDSQPLLLSATGGEQEIILRYGPEDEGFHKLTVSLPIQESEAVTQNNERHVMIQVLKSKLKVLLAAGAPGFEASFMKRALDKEKDFDMTVAVAKRGGGYYSDSFPPSRNDLNAFDAIILLGMTRATLGTSAEELIRDFVSVEGKPLLLIPIGDQGAWAPSPLAELLPVEFTSPRERRGPATMSPQLTTEGLSHPVTRLDEDPSVNELKWSDMPPLLDAVNTCLPKAQAMVLAEYPSLNTAEPALPFISLWSLPQGKTMVINGFPLWRWDFLMWGVGKSNQEYIRFLTNALRWLTTTEQSEFVNMRTSKRMYHSGEPIDFFAQVYNEEYRALDGADVEVTIQRTDTTAAPLESREFSLALLQDEGSSGQYKGRLYALPPGDYQFAGSVSFRNRPLGQATGEFSVEAYSLEFFNTRMNAALLRRISQTSGGRFFTRDDIDGLGNALRLEGRARSLRRSVVLWEHPLLLGTFLVSVFAEWTIRKRKGMV